MSLIEFFAGDEFDILEILHCKVIKINMSDLVFSPFSQMKCLNCGMYKRNWHCAENPNWIIAKKIINNYNEMYILISERDSTMRRNRFYKTHQNMNSYMLHLYTGRQVFAIMKKELNDDVKTIYDYEVRRKRKYKKDFLVFGAGGGCTKCRKCSYLEDPPSKCKKIGESFPSIESWGIDVYKTMLDLNEIIEIPPIDVYKCIGLYVRK